MHISDECVRSCGCKKPGCNTAGWHSLLLPGSHSLPTTETNWRRFLEGGSMLCKWWQRCLGMSSLQSQSSTKGWNRGGKKIMWLFFNSGRDHTMIFFMCFQFWERWKSIRNTRNTGKQRAAYVNLTLDRTMRAKAAFIRFLLCSWENWEQFCKQNPKCGICCGLHLLK